MQVAGLRAYDGLTPQGLHQVEREKARVLFPALAARLDDGSITR